MSGEHHALLAARIAELSNISDLWDAMETCWQVSRLLRPVDQAEAARYEQHGLAAIARVEALRATGRAEIATGTGAATYQLQTRTENHR